MPSQSPAPPLADLRGRLRELTLRDERRLGRRLDRASRTKDPQRRAAAMEAVARQIDAAEAVVARRRAGVPAIDYPAALPVSQAREELLAAIRDHQVVVVAGETGSGKTTQLPKLCLELGRGVRGMIGHTQPRRIAARAVSARIGEELGVELGGAVGFQVRFGDRTGDDTLVKVMTDGILLAEIHRDPMLRAYDTIILDEAHERSLNIDFLLGYLADLLPRRRDLKLVITSATIDPERFANHFGGAPVVEVSGRTYPVEVRYRPLEDAEQGERDQITGICDAVEELVAEGPGDILVFCSGEREIRDTADAIRGLRLRGDVEVLPLYARLSTAEQHRVFAPHQGRRIVVATNVAETSLTVPGIRYVIDPGTARISRYSTRTKVQRLPIEKISQASADQRKGRCGRVAEGICIRLYSEEDFAARPAFTDPEIVRTNLASVVLQMAALGIGDIERFPFVDPPDRRSIRDALALLHELGAVTGEDPARPALTDIGRTLAALPVDPRLARMLIEAHRNGCLREVLVIVAGLSIQDPRERPAEQRGTADALHARFTDEGSDFLAYLNLWAHLRERQRALGSSAFRRECKAEFLHHLRIREWQDLHAQLRAAVAEQGMAVPSSGDGAHGPASGPRAADRAHLIHASLLAGLLSHIGVRRGESREYTGARGTTFVLWPGSSLAGSPPTWVMAAELVETSRLFGRTVGRVSPEWVEQLASHLVKRSYSEPRWSRKRSAVVTTEKVTLYGIPIVAGRTVPLAPIDPPTARAVFIRSALVEGDWRSDHAFRAANQRLLAELAEAEHKTRRRDVVVDPEAVYAFYDARIPADVVSGRHFDAWWKGERRRNPDLLTLTAGDVLGDDADAVDARGRPDTWRQGEVELAVSYRFEPGAPDDGVTVHVPLAALHRLRPVGFDWQVPALRGELVTALLRGLPKDLRRAFVPVPDVAAAVLVGLEEESGEPSRTEDPSAIEPLLDALSRALHRERGVFVPRDAWAVERLPPHLRITFRVFDGDRMLASGKDLPALQRQLAGEARVAVARATGVEVGGKRTWAFGTLPQTVRARRDGHVVEGFPAVVDEGSTVGVRVLLDRADQRRLMAAGTRKLLLLDIPPRVKVVSERLSNAQKLALTRNPHGSVTDLLADATAAAIDALLAKHGGPVWDDGAYSVLRRRIAAEVDDAVLRLVGDAGRVLAAAQDAERRLDAAASPVLQPSVDDARTHLRALVRRGFLTAAGVERVPDLERYVRGIERRLERLAADPARDRALMARVDEVLVEYGLLLRRLGPRADHPAVREIRWMIEELRVSLFAQQLGTRHPVSEQRVFRAIGEAEVAATT